MYYSKYYLHLLPFRVVQCIFFVENCAHVLFSLYDRLCLSISDFHPDTWNPAWSVSTILTGLLSFMVGSSVTYVTNLCN